MDPLQGFYFKDRSDKLNWNAINSINIQNITKFRDLKPLQNILSNITFSKISENDFSTVSGNSLLNLLYIFQLCIEYLVFIQNSFNDSNLKLRSQLQNGQIEIEVFLID
jgi:hypothetical protein